MSGGSGGRESEEDRQCIHCGRWYHSAGLESHEVNCDLQEIDSRVLEIECPFARIRLDHSDKDLFDVHVSELLRGDSPRV